MPYEFDGPNDLYGVFNEEKSVYIGDPFTRDAYQLSRHKGKGFGVPFQPKGKGPDAMIDKTTKLTVPGDTYVEPLAVLKEPKRTSIHNKAFVPVGGTKKPAGSGSLYGVFGPATELLDTDASVAAAGPAKKTDVEKKRAIYVTPPKKGTFGFPVQDRSIGGTKFEFIPDEYCRGRILEKEMKSEARSKINKPFVSTGRTGNGIKALPYTISEGDAASKEGTKKDEAPKSKPWKGTSPTQKGRGYGCISPLVYVPCPESAPKKVDKTGVKPFKPIGGTHNRLSMWAVNPYQYAERPPRDNDFTLTN